MGHLGSSQVTDSSACNPEKSHLSASTNDKCGNNDLQATTNRILKGVSNKLRISKGFVEQDRSALSKQWDIDQAMQTVTVTEKLGKLNDCWNAVEDNLEAAIGLLAELVD